MKFKAKKYERMIVQIKEKGLTISQIMKRFAISRRTAFRWFEYAEAEGHDVVRRGSGAETKYQINFNGENNG